MRRFFVKNLLFTIGVNVLIMPLWVICIDRVVQNRVGAIQYGTYAPLLSLTLIFNIILDFGITNYNTRTISQNPDKLKELFPSMLTARIFMALIYAIIVLGIGLICGYGRREMMLLTGVILIQGLSGVVQFLRSNVAALQKFRVDSVLSVSGRLLMLVICGALLIYPATGRHFKIEWFIETQIICYFISAIICLFVLNRIHPVSFRFSFHVPTLIKIIKDTLPYALLIFLMSVYTRSDVWLIQQLLPKAGKEQAGIYYAAYRWLDSSNMFSLLFAAILLPLFGRMLAQKQDVDHIVTLSVNMLLPVSFMVAVAAAFFGIPIMHVLYPAATANEVAMNYYGKIFGWVMAAFPCFCIMYIYSTLLTANGNLKILNKLAFAGVVINLSLNLFLIPRMNAMGAAITSVVTEGFMAIGFIVFCIRILKVSLNVRWLLSHMGFFALTVLAGYASSLLHIYWLLELVSFGTAGVVLIFLFKFISVNSVALFLNKRKEG